MATVKPIQSLAIMFSTFALVVLGSAIAAFMLLMWRASSSPDSESAAKLYLSSEADWSEHPTLKQSASWRKASGENGIVFDAKVGAHQWQVRVNNFPDEPVYTLLIDDQEAADFEDWPSFGSPTVSGSRKQSRMTPIRVA